MTRSLTVKGGEIRSLSPHTIATALSPRTWAKPKHFAVWMRRLDSSLLVFAVVTAFLLLFFPALFFPFVFLVLAGAVSFLVFCSLFFANALLSHGGQSVLWCCCPAC